MAVPAVVPAGEQRHVKYAGRVTPWVIMACLAVAMGGALFGYDNGVVGGVESMDDFLKKFFYSVYQGEQTSNSANSSYCKFDSQGLQLFTSVLYLAGMAASIPAAWVSKHYGRKVVLVLASLCYVAGAVLVTAAVDLVMLIVGRVLLGIGVACANESATLYNSEMAPAHIRGGLNILFQLLVTIGILAAELINYGTQNLHPWGWRLSLGLAAVPAVLLLIGSAVLPDTPNSLVMRGKREKGRKVLQWVRGVDDVEVEFNDIVYAVDIVNERESKWTAIFSRRYRPQLIICMLIPLFQQFTGINAIIFYAPQLFSSLGSGKNASLLSAVIVGAVNVASTLVAVFGVDRLGRRLLFLEGGVQMIIAEIVIGILIGVGEHNATLSKPMAVVVIVLVCIFVAAFAWSWGPLGWLVPSEICPIEIRSMGMSINVLFNFLFTFIIGQSFLSMLCGMEYGVFFFFAGMVAIATAFVYFFIPETKGLPIEAIEQRFDNHWYWKRYAPLRVAPSYRTNQAELGLAEKAGNGEDIPLD